MLDTNICIYLIKKRPVQVLARLQESKVSEVGVSSIAVGELEYGVEKSQQRNRNKLALLQFLAPLEVVEFDDVAAQHYGRIRAGLERGGQTIGALDLLIAAHARSLGSTLVTNNSREFSRVEDLIVEDWTSTPS